MDENNAWGIILAGGSGSRLAQEIGGQAKQFYNWHGLPLFWHSALAFSRCAKIRGLIFVFPETCLGEAINIVSNLDKNHELGLPWKALSGGKTRAESSRNGILALPDNVDQVLIHDAARPFLQPSLIWRILDALKDAPGAIPAIPVKDTIKLIDMQGKIQQTLPRQNLLAVQTPQGFKVSALKRAWDKQTDTSVTDDAMLLEKCGMEVALVEGDETNVKITSREDVKLLQNPDAMFSCCGFGYDVHKFGEGRPLKVGGVLIPGKYEVLAHSDGDVLLHALIDAILGCACLGDIGQHFPDEDESLAGISSAILLDQVKIMVSRVGVKIMQADLTVVCQVPKLAAFAKEISRNVAHLLNLPDHRVNFKATTEEKLGFTGRKEGIKAYAVVSAIRKREIDG